MNKKITRRYFIISSALLSLFKPEYIFSRNIGYKNFLRPPGSLTEEEFISKCIKCYRCVQVCETGIIQPLSLSESILGVNTPTISYKKSYCNLCMRCVDICPTGAIEDISEDQVRIGLAKIVKDSCIAWDWESCDKCLKICKPKAIYLDEQSRPHIIDNKCNGCGECELICPSLSLRYNSIKTKGVIVFPVDGAKKYEK